MPPPPWTLHALSMAPTTIHRVSRFPVRGPPPPTVCPSPALQTCIRQRVKSVPAPAPVRAAAAAPAAPLRTQASPPKRGDRMLALRIDINPMAPPLPTIFPKVAHDAPPLRPAASLALPSRHDCSPRCQRTLVLPTLVVPAPILPLRLSAPLRPSSCPPPLHLPPPPMPTRSTPGTRSGLAHPLRIARINCGGWAPSLLSLGPPAVPRPRRFPTRWTFLDLLRPLLTPAHLPALPSRFWEDQRHGDRTSCAALPLRPSCA